jgi:antitoxin FitA
MTTLTIKNIPNNVYESLKHAAEINRRSMNSEAIICLETVLAPTQLTATEKLARVRAIRATGANAMGMKLNHTLVDDFKKAGRP